MGKMRTNKLGIPFSTHSQMNSLILTVNIKLQKYIWNAMTKKYVIKYVGTQKYAIGNFRNFQMIEDRDVSSQIHDYHMLINDLVIEDIKLPEPFMAVYLIETLLESWKGYKNIMKHKRI